MCCDAMTSHALSRVLVGKSLIKGWTNVENNRRNFQPISDAEFDAVLAPGLRRGGLTAWVYFYNYGMVWYDSSVYYTTLFTFEGAAFL